MGVVMMAIVGSGPGLGWTPGTWFPAHDLDCDWRRRCACDAEQIEGSARQPVNPRHRHHVAGAEPVEHPLKFAPVGPRAGHFLPVDVPAGASRRPKLLKLAVADFARALTFAVTLD